MSSSSSENFFSLYKFLIETLQETSFLSESCPRDQVQVMQSDVGLGKIFYPELPQNNKKANLHFKNYQTFQLKFSIYPVFTKQQETSMGIHVDCGDVHWMGVG